MLNKSQNIVTISALTECYLDGRVAELTRAALIIALHSHRINGIWNEAGQCHVTCVGATGRRDLTILSSTGVRTKVDLEPVDGGVVLL